MYSRLPSQQGVQLAAAWLCWMMMRRKSCQRRRALQRSQMSLSGSSIKQTAH